MIIGKDKIEFDDEAEGCDFPVDDKMIINRNAEDFDDTISDIDFSQIQGKDFKSKFSQVKRKIKTKKGKKKLKPLTKTFGVGNVDYPYAEDHATIMGGKRQMGKIIIPTDRKVIVEGVSKFIVSQNNEADSVKNIGYYKGKKLEKLILTFNNDSALDFNLELFNPSMPVDYLQSTSLNLNDKIQVAGGFVSYSDVLFNILANPTMIVNATIVASGPSAAAVQTQFAQSFQFTNKSINGDVYIDPKNLQLDIDTMQVQSDIVYFDIMNRLNRPFIPDGMDVIKYVVKAGMIVTMCFYYKQVNLKKFMFKEARDSKILL